MATRLCKSSINDAFTVALDDSLLDLNGHTVPGTAAYYVVATKAADPANPGKYLGGTTGSTAPYLVTGYITADIAPAETLF